MRWYHGAVIVGSKLYAIAGCSDLHSVERLELDRNKEESNGWIQMGPMFFPRHVPGIGALGSKIYVCGGTNDDWTEAFSTVEMLDTESEEWIRLPDMIVAR